MLELVLLLLPVAAASGWFAARRSEAGRDKTSSQEVSPAYFKGLNFLLNEQPDKAIDVFVKLLEVDSDTVETHLALGNLFRRRGEVERAIRIHQNLIARPTLTREQRAQALLELGQDYMRAGLFDRAENLFVELTEIKLHSEQALSNLLVIYQQEKEWDRCLEVAQQLQVSDGHSLQPIIAHFYCEQAQLLIKKGNTVSAIAMLKKAQSVDGGCIRSTILLGEIEKSKDDCRSALKIYKMVEVQDPAYLTEIVPSLIECYGKIGDRAALKDYLKQLYSRHRDTSVMLALTDIITAEEDVSSAVDFVLQHLKALPDLKGLDRLVTLNLQNSGSNPRESMETLNKAVALMLARQSSYQCEQCGFSAKTLHWQCPSCNNWSSMKPIRGLGCGSREK